MPRHFLSAPRRSTTARKTKKNRRAGVSYRHLRCEPLEGRLLLSLGDLLQTFTGPGAGFGSYVEGMGKNNVLVGDYSADGGVGGVYKYNVATGQGTLLFHNPAPHSGDYFGSSIVYLNDRNVVAIGANNAAAHGTRAGAAYAFDADSGQLLHEYKNPSPRPLSDQHFGGGLTQVNGDVVISAPYDAPGGVYRAGIAYRFDGLTDVVLATYQSPTPLNTDGLGGNFALASLDDNSVVIGAAGDPGHPQPGAAYRFDSTTGNVLASFSNPTPAAADCFGVTVATSGDKVIVGAYCKDDPGSNVGQAYIFNKDGVLLHTFHKPAPLTSGAYFGLDIVAVGNYVAVGAPGVGQVYLFDINSGDLVRTISDPTGGSNWFGYSMAVVGNNLVVGSLYGSKVYVFEGSSNAPPAPNPGGPYLIHEGDSLALNGSKSSDPDNDPLSYSWDVNGDGNFGDAAGVSPTLTWADLEALGINDGLTTRNVRLRVDDGHGHVVDSNPVLLTVENAPPTLTAWDKVGPAVPMVGYTPNRDGSYPVYISPDGQYMLVDTYSADGSQGVQQRIWDATTNRWLPPTPLRGGGDPFARTSGLNRYGYLSPDQNSIFTFDASRGILRSLWQASTQTWSNPSVVVPGGGFYYPTFNGRQLFFNRSVPSGPYVAVSDYDPSTDTFSTPQELTSIEAVPADTQSPWVSQDGKRMVLASNRAETYGDLDLFSATWNGSTWTGITNLGRDVNSGALDNLPRVAEYTGMLSIVTVPSWPPVVMQAMYSIADVTTNEGQTVNKTGNWHDVLADRPHVALTASVGTIIKHDDGTWDWSYTPPDGPATQVVTITADDGEPNGTSSISFTLTVNNVAPHDLVISADPSTIDEGSSTTLTGSFVDPGVLDTHTVTIDWGDGSPKTTRQLPRGDREFSIQKPTPYADNKAGNAPYTITATVSDAVAVTYDLAGDWSDTSNPNGVWSYNSAPGVPINVHWDDYDPTADSLFIHPQPAWAYAYNPDSSGQSRHVPFWAKIVSETVTSPYWYYFDLPIGVVGMHGSNTDHANVAWTSPLTGRVQISGDTWLARKNIGRDAEWRILLNGVAITGGSLYHNDPYTSASPFQFAQGWGGSAALSLEVSEGDVIAVELYKSPTTPYGEVMGLDLRIVSESGDGGTTKATTEAIVSNVAPHDLAISASPSTIDEGSTTTLSGSFVDPGVLDAHTVTIDWGDGSPKSTREFGPGVLEFSIEKPTPYTDNKPHNEPYTITATVTGGEDAGPDREYELVRSFSAGGQPAGVDVDSLGNVWVADYGSSQVQQYAKSGTLLQSYGGGLLHPYDVAVSPLGTIWVADNFHYQVKEFSSPGTLLQTVGYFVQQPGPPGSFDSPTGVKVDASGNVWVTEDYNHRVQVFSSSGALIRSFGTAVPGDTAPSYPYDVAFTSSGSVWVVDIGTNAIKEFTSDGVFLRKFTDQFVYPLGIAIGASGNIFVADLGNRVVKEFTEDLQFLGSFGAFSDLRHINLDSSGHVWTADIGANLIQEFAPSGGGAAVTASTTAIVRNVPPTVDAGPDMRANEGDRVTFSGSFSDPGILDTHTIRWDFGDGTEPVYGTLTPTHVYADNGEYPVTLTVIDKDGEPGSDTLTVGARSRR